MTKKEKDGGCPGGIVPLSSRVFFGDNVGQSGAGEFTSLFPSFPFLIPPFLFTMSGIGNEMDKGGMTWEGKGCVSFVSLSHHLSLP